MSGRAAVIIMGERLVDQPSEKQNRSDIGGFSGACWRNVTCKNKKGITGVSTSEIANDPLFHLQIEDLSLYSLTHSHGVRVMVTPQ
jgi:hypothetical protein